MAKDRTGKFWWEYVDRNSITLKSMRGTYDPALSTDCRCGCSCEVCPLKDLCGAILSWIAMGSVENWGEEISIPDELPVPWIAMGSIANWGEEILTPEGLPDGDMIHWDPNFIPDLHELFAIFMVISMPKVKKKMFLRIILLKYSIILKPFLTIGTIQALSTWVIKKLG